MPIHEKEILDSQDIIQPILRGDSRGYEILFDRYGAMLLGIITRIVKNETDAENLLQDCFLEIWRKINTFNSEKERFTIWLINIARRCAMDFVQSKHYIQRIENQNIDSIVHSKDIVDIPIVQDKTDMRMVIEKLTPQYRQIIEWMYFEGYSQLEISENFGIPISTVKTQTRLAVLELRQFFDTV
jgi:RNA polymerase sigma-70 factor, ECF subfamily